MNMNEIRRELDLVAGMSAKTRGILLSMRQHLNELARCRRDLADAGLDDRALARRLMRYQGMLSEQFMFHMALDEVLKGLASQLDVERHATEQRIFNRAEGIPSEPEDVYGILTGDPKWLELVAQASGRSIDEVREDMLRRHGSADGLEAFAKLPENACRPYSEICRKYSAMHPEWEGAADAGDVRQEVEE